jgi:hypothetical protein
MESAAEEALLGDSAFSETLRALKAEIDRDPRVQSAVSRVHAAGSRVFSSLVPRIKIRIRTSAGEISLPDENKTAAHGSSPVAHLTQELKSAATAVIRRGRYREVLDRIMNDAVGASERFEGIAAEVEREGYEIVICLDLSAYAQVRESAEPGRSAKHLLTSGERLTYRFSRQDLEFLKDLKISASES